jgi:hypothetical protein
VWQQLLLLLPLLMAHLACSNFAAGATAVVNAAADGPSLQRAVCYLELRGHSSNNLGAPEVPAANLTCTSSSGRKVPVSTNMLLLMQHTGSSKTMLHNITLSGVDDVVDTECQDHAASLNASGFQPLLFFCGNYKVVFISPVVHQVHLQDAEDEAADRNSIVFAFAGRVRASISNGSFHGNSLGSIVVLLGNASVTASNSTFGVNQLQGSCIRVYDFSKLHVMQTAFESNIAYAALWDGGAVLRIAGSSQAAFTACRLVNSTATAPQYDGNPANSGRWAGAVNVDEFARLRMQSCVLRDNVAQYGGSVRSGGNTEVQSSLLLQCNFTLCTIKSTDQMQQQRHQDYRVLETGLHSSVHHYSRILNELAVPHMLLAQRARKVS